MNACLACGARSEELGISRVQCIGALWRHLCNNNNSAILTVSKNGFRIVCARILTPNGTSKKVLKPWYARSTKDGDQSLSDIFYDFASGEFDDSRIAIDEKYRTVQVRYFIIYHKKNLSSFRVTYVYNIKIEMVLPIFKKYASNISY